MVEYVKNISEFKLGMSNFQEGKLTQAEEHIKECLKILKNINQTDSFAYIFILKKYSQILFYNKKYEECEKLLKASIQISQKVFQNSHEFMFPYYRNLVAFYTHTDIGKASEYISILLQQENVQKSNVHKYFIYAGGSIKFLNDEYSSAKELINRGMTENLPMEYQAFNLHNNALLNLEMKRTHDLLPEKVREQWAKHNNYITNENEDVDKSSILLYKQALAKLELDTLRMDRDEIENKLINSFLLSDLDIPKDLSEEVYLYYLI